MINLFPTYQKTVGITLLGYVIALTAVWSTPVNRFRCVAIPKLGPFH